MRVTLLLPILFFFTSSSWAQYTVNGNASRDNCNCYTLTQNFDFQSGSVWNNNRIDLSQSFDFTFTVFLGCSDQGADGIAFVLQPISTSVGGSGNGMGFAGITPSVGVTLDTYQNTSPDNDPSYDHIAIQLNGDVVHTSANTLTPLIAISALTQNVEDCQNHFLRIVWDAPTHTLTVYFDGIQRVSSIYDFTANVFSGNPHVFWGFTGATGGESNNQRFCTSLTPKYTLLPNQKRCVGEPIQFMDSTVSFGGILKRYWDFGDGSPIDSINLNPVHTYTQAGDYTITVTVLAIDSCSAVFTQNIRIGSKPLAGFSRSDSCAVNNIQFFDTSYTQVGTINQWYWDLDNGQVASTQNPSSTYATYGTYNIRMAVGSQEGCLSDTIVRSVYVHAIPVADFLFTDSVCVGNPVSFTATGTLADGSIQNWNWTYSDSTGTVLLNNPAHVFSQPGNHQATLILSGAAGCRSNPVTKNIFIVDKPHAAFASAQACEGQLMQFQDSSYNTDGLGITGWWWDLGNGQNSTQQNPQTIYTTPGTVTVQLAVTNNKFCSSDTLVQPITIGEKPVAYFGMSTSFCNNAMMHFYDSSTVSDANISVWQWVQADTGFSNLQNPSGFFPPGIHQIGLVVETDLGCISDTSFRNFTIKTKPEIEMFMADTCKFAPVEFAANETVTNIGVSSWHWDFGDGNISTANPAIHVYPQNGLFEVKLYGMSVEGCSSDTLVSTIQIYGTNAFAGEDIIAAANQPVQLQATGGLSYEWTPSTGLSATDIPNPVASNPQDQTYILKAFTPEGCESYDTLHVKIYDGPEMYVPTAFTPNGDGLNDIFRILAVGITQFDRLLIFNRYGEKLFETRQPDMGWDGKQKGKEQPTGTYVWMVSGTDFLGNKIFKKGTVLLIR